MTLCRGGETTIKKVHVLVAEAFLPRPSWATLVRHKDDDKSRNDVANLEWGTARENGQDKVRNGRTNPGAANPKAKLTREQVEEIRSSSESNRKTAEQFGISQMQVWRIRRGLRWVSP